MVAACTLSGFVANAQKENVGIGTTKPDQSAILDLNSSTKGLLMPRLSLQQRTAIQNPANGLIVYQTDMLSGFYFFDGKEWKPLSSSTTQNSVANDPNDWSFSGNLPAAGSYVGTQAGGIDLEFKINGVHSGVIANTSGNTHFGYRAGANSPGTYNTAIGWSALMNSTASDNLAIGSEASRYNTSGAFNVAIGNGALTANTIGSYNVAIGSQALITFNPALADRGYNNAIGFRALQFNQTGVDNTGIGVSSLRQLTNGTFNMAIGGYALENTNGNFNTGIGNYALNANTTGTGNTAIGAYALANKGLGGNNNTAIGNYAGRNLANGQSGNLFLGYEAGYAETGSDKLYIANSSTTTPLVYGDFTAKFVAIGDITASPAKRDGLAAQYGLLVQKGILTEKIKVATLASSDWADYVFEEGYKSMPLEDVERFVKENKHLPNVPTTVEMMSNGNDLIKTDAKLLEKIEELTLYVIEINKQLQELKKENKLMKSQLNK